MEFVVIDMSFIASKSYDGSKCWHTANTNHGNRTTEITIQVQGNDYHINHSKYLICHHHHYEPGILFVRRLTLSKFIHPKYY